MREFTSIKGIHLRVTYYESTRLFVAAILEAGCKQHETIFICSCARKEEEVYAKTRRDLFRKIRREIARMNNPDFNKIEGQVLGDTQYAYVMHDGKTVLVNPTIEAALNALLKENKNDHTPGLFPKIQMLKSKL